MNEREHLTAAMAASLAARIKLLDCWSLDPGFARTRAFQVTVEQAELLLRDALGHLRALVPAKPVLPELGPFPGKS